MDGDGRLDEAGLAHMKGIRRILRFLAEDGRIAHMHGRIHVFGSAAAGKARPGDVDALVDFSDWSGSVLDPYAIPQAGLLLAVGRQFYGSFDPFVLVGPHLYVRDDACAGWTGARHARSILAKARAEGRPPADVLAEIKARPRELGGLVVSAKPEAEAEPEDVRAPGP